jgi:CcmD family protein
MNQQEQPKPTTPTTPSERSTEFVAVQGGGDTTSAGTLLIAAYIIMWALLVGFIALTWRRQQRIDARIGELEKLIAQHNK